jgi:predicted adenylyl cyclase CyaB
MARNLEIKIKLDSFGDIIERLGNMGASDEGILNQKDIYYHINNGLLKLRVQDGENLLIKYNRDETGSDRWSDYDILKLEGGDAEKYLNDIFTIETTVIKERKLYLFKDTRIHLDSVTGLGLFLELETVVTSSLNNAKRLFGEMVQLLELDTSRQILKSYRDLLIGK